MAAGTLAKRWPVALAAPFVVLALGAGFGMAGVASVGASSGVLAQGGCYQPPQTPGLYNPPDYSNCGSGPYIKPQGWPAPKPKQPSAPQ